MMYKMMEMVEMQVPMMMGTALLTLGESKWLGSAQSSEGPESKGTEMGSGWKQPFADGMKLMMKENMKPKKSKEKWYKMGPMMTMSMSMMMWVVMPMKETMMVLEEKMSMLMMLSMSTLGVYGMIYSGWGSNTSYGFMGTLSSTAQVMSYEMSMGMMMMMMMMKNKTMNMLEMMYNQIYMWNMNSMMMMGMMFVMSSMAETNSAPMDLVEAESELVAGTLVEYSGGSFMELYLAEYLNMVTMSTVTSVMLLGGGVSSMKTMMMTMMFMWVSATLPSLSFTDLMGLGFTKILPISMSNLMVIYCMEMMNKI